MYIKAVTLELYLEVSQKLQTELPDALSWAPFLSISINDFICDYKDTCTSMINASQGAISMN